MMGNEQASNRTRRLSVSMIAGRDGSGSEGAGVAATMGETTRGQTTLDFAIGVSIFLLVVTFVLAFLPGMVDPFVDGGSEKPVVANRIADGAAKGMLGDPTKPSVLNSACTLAFFEEGDGDVDHDVSGECRFEDNDVGVRERVGVETRGHASYGLRIRIVADLDDDGTSSVLIHCDSDGRLRESCSGTAYTVGGAPPDDSGSVSVSRRTVYLPDGQGVTATLLVEVW